MSLVEALLASLLAAMVGAGLVRAFVAQGEFQAGWIETRDAERSVGSAVEIVARAIEEAGYVGCRSTTVGAMDGDLLVPPFDRAVEIEAGSVSDVVITYRVDDSLPVVSYGPASLVAIGRFDRKPKAGRVMVAGTCRGAWAFPATRTRHLTSIGQKRTEVFGDLVGIARAIAGPGGDGEPDADGVTVAPGGTRLGILSSRRFFVGPNTDEGSSLWIALNGGRSMELVRGVDRLEAERIAVNLVRVRIEAVVRTGRVARERTLVVRSARQVKRAQRLYRRLVGGAT